MHRICAKESTESPTQSFCALTLFLNGVPVLDQVAWGDPRFWLLYPDKPPAATHPCWKLNSKSWCFNPTPYCCWLGWTSGISPTCIWVQPLAVAKMFVFLSRLSYSQSLRYPLSTGLQREAGCPETVVTLIHLAIYPNIQNRCLSIPRKEPNQLRNMGHKGNKRKKINAYAENFNIKFHPFRNLGWLTYYLSKNQHS